MRKVSWMMALCLAVVVVWQIPGCGGLIRIEVPFNLGTGPGQLGSFDVEAGTAATNAGTGSISVDAPDIGSGTIRINPEDITVTPADATGGKASVAQQESTTLQITAKIAAVDLVDTICDEDVGEQYGPYLVTLDADYVPIAVDPSTLTLTQTTIDLLNAGEFSLCVEVLSPVTGTVTVANFTFVLSP